eukprot:IDg8308t1
MGKSSKFRGLSELKCSHEGFNEALSYRIYRLNDTSQASSDKVSAKIGQYNRLTRHAMEGHTFSDERPIEVLPFLSQFRTTCNHNGISEAAAVRLLPKYLKGEAKKNFQSYSMLRSSRLRGFSSYTESVQHLLKSFASEEVIIAAVFEFYSLKKGDKEEEMEFGLRFRDTASFSENSSVGRHILRRIRMAGERPEKTHRALLRCRRLLGSHINAVEGESICGSQSCSHHSQDPSASKDRVMAIGDEIAQPYGSYTPPVDTNYD